MTQYAHLWIPLNVDQLLAQLPWLLIEQIQVAYECRNRKFDIR